MAEPFLGEIRYFSFNFPPKGWSLCNGQLLPINQNQALFALLGTTFGGNGTTTFALPNLQGRVPMGSQGGNPTEGQIGGEESHTLIAGEIPTHTHLIAGGGAATTASPSGGYLASPTSGSPYAPPPASATVALAAAAVGSMGGGQPHENRQPFLTVTACIALQGIFPSRN